MRIAALADIHGNLPAFEAVLADLPPVDAIVCAGDLVGYYPWPAEVVALIQQEAIISVQGNHDRAVATGAGFRFHSAAQAGVDVAIECLSEAEREWLAELPQSRTLFNGSVKIVHGHPDDPDRYTYPEAFTPNLLAGEDILILGHTHVQHAAMFPEGTIVNPGSVGQPRDGEPGAAYALIDLQNSTVEDRRVSYDIDRVVAKVKEADLPRSLGERLRNGR